MNVPVTEAKAKFSELLRRVEAGEDIVLTRDGKPVARLCAPEPAASRGERRRASKGTYRGQIWIADDFDELGPEWDPYLP